MPAKPGFSERLRNTTCWASATVEDRHPVDRRSGRGLRGRVDDVVRADDEHEVGGLEPRIDLVHLDERLVRHVRLGEQHVHVAGHAARDGMDAEHDVDAAALQHLGELGRGMVRPGDREPVPGDDHDPLRVVEEDRDVVGLHRAHRPVDRSAARCRPPPGAEGAEHDAGDRAAHGLGHRHREDRSAGPHERARDQQQHVRENETGCRDREPRERVEQRDHDRARPRRRSAGPAARRGSARPRQERRRTARRRSRRARRRRRSRRARAAP